MIDNYTGSLIFTKGKTPISGMIILAQRLADRPHRWNPFKLGDANKSHVEFINNANWSTGTHIHTGMRRHALRTIKEKAKKFSIYQPLFLNDITKRNMYLMNDLMTGQKYGGSKLPLYFMDCLFATYWFTKRFSITNFRVCIQQIAWVYQKAPTVYHEVHHLDRIISGRYDHPKELNYKFGCDWKSLNVDKGEDWVKSRPHEWKLIEEV